MNPVPMDIMLDHNRWAMGVLIEDARGLSREQFQRRFAIGPGSIHDTLRHIVSALGRWADRIGDAPLRESFDRAGAVMTCDQLSAALHAADADLRRVAARRTDEGGWSTEMELRTEEGQSYRFTRAAAFVHVMLHGAHHRAQIMNMRRQLGLASLPLDLDPVEWECVQSGQIP